MKKLITLLSVAFVLVFLMAFVISAETITVTDDSTTEITLGDCVIEGLDREIPQPSRGFTYQLDTEAKTAKVSDWANKTDETLGQTFCLPSTVTYDGVTYKVTSFSAVGNAYTNNTILVTVAIPDTVTSIPNNAFDACRTIRYVYVGNGVETIGKYSFRNIGFTADSSVDENGEMKGNIRDFIWKTTKVTTLSEQCFFHMDFNKENVIEFPFDKITTYESGSMAYNQHAFQTGHNFSKQFYLDVFDISNATSVASNAFDNAALAQTIILRADQTNALAPQKLRGQGTAQPDLYYNFIIVGGETAETAKTLSGCLWTSNAWYWGSKTHCTIAFRGYVNAYDGTDGLENQNGYGNDVVDYFFESEAAFNHYINSVKTTTNASTTLTRYAKNTKGYFNVCTVVDGAHSFKAYNLSYTAATEEATEIVTITEYTQTNFSFGIPSYDTVIDDDCTSSNLCFVCDFIFTKGLEHEIGTTYEYANGYTNKGLKVVGCIRCLKGEEIVLAPLFESYGYSKDEKGVGIVNKVKVNKEAILAYEAFLSEQKGETVVINYGILAAISAGEDSAPLMQDGTVAEGYKAVVANMTNTEYTILSVKICGITDVTTKLNCNVYVIIDNQVKYINHETTDEYATSISYNQL